MATNNKNPYIGPRTFLKEEGDRFYGREREARDLLALVSSQQMVLFYAQSGAGKSSLINTRLIPSLEEREFEVLPVGRVSGDVPTGVTADNVYIYNLMHTLIQRESLPKTITGLSLADFFAHLSKDETGYFFDENSPNGEPAEDYIPWNRALIIDQFEEIFSSHPEAWKKREDFFLQLADAMSQDQYLWVVLVMREDYIASLDPYAHLLPGGMRTRYYLQRLERDAALRAIKNPVEKLRPYAEGVAEKLADDLAKIKLQKADETTDAQPEQTVLGQYIEPVQLQVICYNLWEELLKRDPDGREITSQHLQDIGDVDQTLGKFYAERVKTVAEEKGVREHIIRNWFEKTLITPDGIRNVVTQSKSSELGQEVIKALSGDLVRAERRGGVLSYELTHDRLVSPILKNNKEWFAANLSPLQKQAALWDQQERHEAWLLLREALDDVERWAQKNPDELTELENDFLDACRAKQQEINEKRRSQRRFLTFVVSSLIVLIGISVFAVSQWQAANRLKADANTVKLVAIAQKNIDLQPDLAALLGIASYDQNPNLLETQSILLANAQNNTRLIAFLTSSSNRRASDFLFSPDMDTLAVKEKDDNCISLWSVTDIRAGMASPECNIQSSENSTMFFSADGKRLVLLDGSGIHLWDVADQKPIGTGSINYNKGGVDQVVFASVSGKDKIISLGEDNGIVILAPDLKSLPDEVEGTSGSAETVLSPDGLKAATLSDEGNIKLINIQTGTPIGDSMTGKAIAFSSDGKNLIIVDDGLSVTLMDTEKFSSSSARTVDTGLSSGDELRQILISPNGWYLALSTDYSVSIVDLKDEKLQAVSPVSFSYPITLETFSGDKDDYLILSGYSYNISGNSSYVLNTIKKQYVDLEGEYVGFVPNGNKVIVYRAGNESSMQAISLLNLNVAEKIKPADYTIPGDPDALVTFSRSGNSFAVLQSDSRIAFYNKTDGQLIVTSDPLELKSIDQMLFSDDGKRLAVLGRDGGMVALDVSDTKSIKMSDEKFLDEDGSLTSISFDPQSNDYVLVMGFSNGKLILWDVDGEQKISEIDAGHKEIIDSLHFDPNGMYVLTTSSHSVAMVDLASGSQVGEPMDGSFVDLNWDKKRLLTNDKQKQIFEVWNLDTRKAVSYDGDDAVLSPDGNVLAVSSTVRSDATDMQVFAVEPVVDGISVVAPTPPAVETTNETTVWNLATGDKIQLDGAGLVRRFNKDSTFLLTYTYNPQSDFDSYSYGYVQAWTWDWDKKTSEKIWEDTHQFYPDPYYEYFDSYNISQDDIIFNDAVDGKDRFFVIYDRYYAQLTIYDSSTLEYQTTYYISGSGFSVKNWFFSPDGTELIVRSSDDYVYVFNLLPNRPSCSISSLWVKNPPQFTPDSKSLVYANLDGSMGVCDTETAASQVLRYHSPNLNYSLQNYALGPDGKTLATLGNDGDLLLWDINGPTINGTPIDGYDDYVSPASLSSDGKRLAMFTNHDIVLRDEENGQELGKFNDHILYIDGLSLVSGNVVLTSNWNGPILLYDVQTGERIGDRIDDSLTMTSPKGKFFVTVKDNTYTLWKTSTAEKIKEFPPENFRQVVSFSPDDNILAVKTETGLLAFFNTEDGSQLGEPINGVFGSFNSTGKYAYISTHMNHFIIWDSSTPNSINKPIEGLYPSFSSGGKYLAYTRIADPDEKEDLPITIILDLAKGKSIGDLPAGNISFINDDFISIIPPSGEGTYIYRITDLSTPVLGPVLGEFSGMYDGSTDLASLYDYEKGGLFLWDTKTREFINTTPIPANSVAYPLVSSDRRYAFVYDYYSGSYNLWDIENIQSAPMNEKYIPYGSPSFFADPKTGKTESLIVFNPYGETVLIPMDNVDEPVSITGDIMRLSSDSGTVATLNGGNLSLWDVQTKKEDTSLDKIYPGTISDMKFSSDNSTLIVSGDNGILLWDVQKKALKNNGELLQEKLGYVQKLVFSPDGKYLASLGVDDVIVWDAATLKRVSPTLLDSQKAHALDMSFNKNDDLIYVTDGGRVYTWNEKEGAVEVGPPLPTNICNPLFSPDGTYLVYQINSQLKLKNFSQPGKSLDIDDELADCGEEFTFSPPDTAGGQILAYSDHNIIYLYDLTANDAIGQLINSTNTNSVVDVEFINNEILASETYGGLITLWDRQALSQFGSPLYGNLSNFTSQHSTLLYRGPNGKVLTLDLSTDVLLKKFPDFAGELCIKLRRNLSKNEWQQYFPDSSYPDQKDLTCPQWIANESKSYSTDTP